MPIQSFLWAVESCTMKPRLGLLIVPPYLMTAYRQIRLRPMANIEAGVLAFSIAASVWPGQLQAESIPYVPIPDEAGEAPPHHSYDHKPRARKAEPSSYQPVEPKPMATDAAVAPAAQAFAAPPPPIKEVIYTLHYVLSSQDKHEVLVDSETPAKPNVSVHVSNGDYLQYPKSTTFDGNGGVIVEKGGVFVGFEMDVLLTETGGQGLSLDMHPRYTQMVSNPRGSSHVIVLDAPVVSTTDLSAVKTADLDEPMTVSSGGFDLVITAMRN